MGGRTVTPESNHGRPALYPLSMYSLNASVDCFRVLHALHEVIACICRCIARRENIRNNRSQFEYIPVRVHRLVLSQAPGHTFNPASIGTHQRDPRLHHVTPAFAGSADNAPAVLPCTDPKWCLGYRVYGDLLRPPPPLSVTALVPPGGLPPPSILNLRCATWCASHAQLSTFSHCRSSLHFRAWGRPSPGFHP